MNRRKELILLVIFCISIFTFSIVIECQGATREWNASDVILWGQRMELKTKSHYLENEITDQLNIEMINDFKYNITAVDTVAKTYDTLVYSSIGSYLITNINYGMDNYINSLDLSINVGVQYEWNFANNKSVLRGFDFDLQIPFLIEPNWNVLNAFLKDFFNESKIVDTYVDPYTTTTYNVTFAEVLADSKKYDIMGVKNNLAKAKERFSEELTSWSFSFDFSNILHQAVYNSTSGYYDYYPFEKFTLGYSGSYTEGGILQKQNHYFDSVITIEDEKNEVYYSITFELGGIKSKALGFNMAILLPFIATITLSYTLIKKKKRQ